MVYPYKCVKCTKAFEIEKPMKDSGRVERCDVCEEVLVLDYQLIQAAIIIPEHMRANS